MTLWFGTTSALIALFLQLHPSAPAPAPASQEPDVSLPAVAAPTTPTAEMQPVQFVAGEWVHEKEAYHGGVVGIPAGGAARSKATWVHGGHHLSILYRSARSGQTYEARGFVSWDGKVKAYRLDWFDSLGQVLRFSGELDPAGVLVFRGEYEAFGQRVKQVVSIKKQRSGKVLILDERAIGDAPAALYMESLAVAAAAVPKAVKTPPAAPSPIAKPTTAK
jgi:hypothetical protein